MVAGYVYLITNRVTGKKYVGCTTGTIENRWQQHVKDAKRGLPYMLHRSLRKHGEGSFKVEPLETVEGSHEDLLQAEIAWIQRQDCVVPNGYNLTHGGQGLDFSVPEVREAQLQGSRKRSATASWRTAQSEAKLKLHADPEFKKRHTAALRKKAQDPAWLQANAESNRSKPNDPEWREAHAEGIRTRSANQTWRDNLVEGARKRVANPDWQRASAEALSKGRAIIAAEALARDALCSPEERARRVKRREAVRRSAAKRKRQRLVGA